MEEEIIGNRWKELDYDGYYLVSPPYAHLSPLVSHSPLRGTYGGERRTEEMSG